VFSSRRRHTRFSRDWSSDVCSSDLPTCWVGQAMAIPARHVGGVEAGQGARADDHVLDDLVNRVADVDAAVGVGRAVVQDELRTRSEERRVGKVWRWWWAPQRAEEYV